MLKTLKSLLVEQTSPAEVLLFIAVSVTLFLAAAAFIYALFVSILWALRLRPHVAYRRLLFPTGAQLRKSAGEVILATATSLILVATLVAKHDLIEDIRDDPIGELSSSAMANLFPAHDFPEELERHLTEGASVSVQALLQPVLQAGRSADAKVFVEALVAEKSLDAVLHPSLIVAIAVTIALVYLGALGWGRIRQLKTTPEMAGAPAYREAAGRLSVLALCISLLLAAPRVLADASIVEGTLAAVHHQDVVADKHKTANGIIVASMERQLALFPYLRFLENGWEGEDDTLMGLVKNTRKSLLDLETRVGVHDERQNEVDAGLAGDLGKIAGELGKSRDEMEGFGNQLERLERLRSDADSRIADLAEQDRQNVEGLEELKVRTAELQSDLELRLDGLQTTLDGQAERYQREVRSLGIKVAKLEAQIEDVQQHEQRLTQVEEALETVRKQLHTTGTLVVFVHPGDHGTQFVLSGPENRNFQAPGVLKGLKPGRYQVTPSRPGVSSQSVSLVAGEVVGLRFPRRPEQISVFRPGRVAQGPEGAAVAVEGAADPGDGADSSIID